MVEVKSKKGDDPVSDPLGLKENVERKLVSQSHLLVLVSCMFVREACCSVL